MAATRKVYKYALDPNKGAVSMPEGSRILTVAAQGDDVMLWALVDPDAPTEDRVIFPATTGEAVSGDAHYLGTAVGVSGWIVVHVFEDA